MDNEIKDTIMLTAILKSENCLIFKNNSKEEILNGLLENLKATGKIRDIEALKKELFFREIGRASCRERV